MEGKTPADQAVQGLTDWEGIAKLVEAFGGGWEAVATIAALALSVTFTVCWVALLAYWSYDSKNRTQVEIARIKALGRGEGS
jgi:hypothetical protein